jgi:hypothetical protein
VLAMSTRMEKLLNVEKQKTNTIFTLYPGSYPVVVLVPHTNQFTPAIPLPSSTMLVAIPMGKFKSSSESK